MKMKYCSGEHSIGDQRCNVSNATITRYLNEPMTYTSMLNFYNVIAALNPTLPEHIIRNYNKSNSTAFGRYKYQLKEIHIFHSCVWTFLHELAHAIQFYVLKDRDAAHGWGYIKSIDYIVDIYHQYKQGAKIEGLS
jgi:hypothetical protein